MLRYLVEHRGRLLTRDELLTAVRGEAIVTDGSLTQCLIDIRRALSPTGSPSALAGVTAWSTDEGE